MLLELVEKDFLTVFDSVAQLVEQLTLNQRVQGSSPCGVTKNLKVFKMVDFKGFFSWLEIANYN